MLQENKEVVILPEVYDFLYDLAQILFYKDYVSWMESADAIIDDIVDYARMVPCIPFYNLTPLMQKRFGRYGKNLHYVFFKRKTSKHTTWYIFFTRQNDRYIVRYVTNNHKDGKYIRNSFSDTEQ